MMITSIEFDFCVCKSAHWFQFVRLKEREKIVTGCIVIPFSSFECESAEHLLCFVYYKL